jgi:hypothetical protein
MSLRTRLIAILAATASVAIALALLFQDRTLASDLRRAAGERLERSAAAANRWWTGTWPWSRALPRDLGRTAARASRSRIADPRPLRVGPPAEPGRRASCSSTHGRTVAAVGGGR